MRTKSLRFRYQLRFLFGFTLIAAVLACVGQPYLETMWYSLTQTQQPIVADPDLDFAQAAFNNKEPVLIPTFSEM